MKFKPSLNDISIRNEFLPGDISYISYLHSSLYKKEYDYGIGFEIRCAEGLIEFQKIHDPERSRVWICEHENKIIGFLMLLDRGDAAQLRFFLIHPDYRGIGLGKKLMDLYFEFHNKCNYKSSYLWTTNDLSKAASIYKRYGFVLTEEKDSTDFDKYLKEQRYDL